MRFSWPETATDGEQVEVRETGDEQNRGRSLEVEGGEDAER